MSVKDIFTEEAALSFKLHIGYVIIIIIVIFTIICLFCIAFAATILHLCTAKRKLRHLELSIANLEDFKHYCHTEEVINTDYETINDTKTVHRKESSNIFSLDSNSQVPATITNDSSHSGTIVARSNTSQCSDNTLSIPTEISSSECKIVKEPITLPSEGNNKMQKKIHSSLAGPINDQDHPTITKFKRIKVQVEKTTSDQLSALPKQNARIRKSNSETTITRPSHNVTYSSLPSITASTDEQIADIFSKSQGGDLVNGLVENATQSLEPVCNMQNCSSNVVTTGPINSLASTCNIQDSLTSRLEAAQLNSQQSCNTDKTLDHTFYCTNVYDTPSSKLSNENSSDAPKIPQKIRIRKSVHLVAINIPFDNGGMPTVCKDATVTDNDIATQYIGSDEAVDLQGNPAYAPYDDIATHLYEEIPV